MRGIKDSVPTEFNFLICFFFNIKFDNFACIDRWIDNVEVINTFHLESHANQSLLCLTLLMMMRAFWYCK